MACHRLLLHRRVEPRVEQEDALRNGEVEAHTARAEGEQHHAHAPLLTEAAERSQPLLR